MGEMVRLLNVFLKQRYFLVFEIFLGPEKYLDSNQLWQTKLNCAL